MTTSAEARWEAGVPAGTMEEVRCYGCGADDFGELARAQDDLTGKPGLFRFVRCARCGLAYQNPRVKLDFIRDYYDDRYIAHRQKRDLGPLTPLYERAMESHDRAKDRIVRRHVALGPSSEVLDVGCAVGTFLIWLNRRHGSRVTGVDFKELKGYPGAEVIDFRCGLFYEQAIDKRFDLITMWHFLEHDYDPLRSLSAARELLAERGKLIVEVPRLDSVSARLFGDRWPGLQAPQHTVLFDRNHLVSFVERSGLRVVEYLPYGAFPAYFYLFTGVAFHFLQGRGLDVQRALLPYFVGQASVLPVILLEKRLNLAMQTVVCERA